MFLFFGVLSYQCHAKLTSVCIVVLVITCISCIPLIPVHNPLMVLQSQMTQTSFMSAVCFTDLDRHLIRNLDIFEQGEDYLLVAYDYSVYSQILRETTSK